MSIWTHKFGTGKGMYHKDHGAAKQYIWNGHSFWPSYEDQNFDEDYIDFESFGFYIQTTNFDLTDFQSGHEVVLLAQSLTWNSDIGFQTWGLEFIDPEGTQLFFSHYVKDFFDPSPYDEYNWYIWLAIGVRPKPYPEIWKNGTYLGKATGIRPQTVSFTVTNLDESRLTLYPGKEGTMWIEGNYLWYISWLGTKHFIIPEPGGELLTGKYGAVWISNSDYRIHWTDQWGVHRKSKLGDKYWTDTWGTSPTYAGVSKAGYTWMCNGTNWTTFQYVAQDGYVVRHGPGYIRTGDMQ